MRNLHANKINIIPKEIVRNSTWHKSDKTDHAKRISTITTLINLILCQPKSSNNAEKGYGSPYFISKRLHQLSN